MQNIHRYMLFLSVFVLIILACGRVGRGLWWTNPATGTVSFGMASARCLLATQRRAAQRLFVRLSFDASCRGAAASTSCRARRSASAPIRAVSCLNRRHMLWAWTSLFTVGFSDLYVRLCSMASGRIFGFSSCPNEWTIRPPNTTCSSIGAGGAGLRAAIEASAAGVSVGLVCKSLLGKRTPSWQRAALPPRWPTSTTATTGRCISPTRCAAANT